MLGSMRSLAVSRVGAALVALALTGVPHLASTGHVGGAHRCSCKAHVDHECTCPICRATALATRLAEAGKLPPCHRGAALAEARGQVPARESAEACMKGTCGVPEQPRTTPAGIEPFLIPQATALAAPGPTGQPPAAGAVPRAVPREPETPPPRPA
jgi:hypothetical protein